MYASEAKVGDFFISNSKIRENDYLDIFVVLPNKKYYITKISIEYSRTYCIGFNSEQGYRLIRVDNYMYSGKIKFFNIKDERKTKIESIL